MSDLIKMMALGRPFSIGTLYNYVEDIVIPNALLWDPNDVSNLSEVVRKNKKAIKLLHNVAASDTLVVDISTVRDGDNVQRPSLFPLEMDDHSALSFAAGMICPAIGAWKYAEDRVNESIKSGYIGSQVIVHSRCVSKKVSVDPTGNLEIICRLDKISSSKATHVVVAITYGLEAFCVFPLQKAYDEESMEQILTYARIFTEGLLEDRCHLVPDQDEEGDQEDGGQMKIPLDFNCILYSDLMNVKRGPSWTSLPVTEQYEACRNLLGNQTKKAVPLKVWLYPLDKLITTETKICKMPIDNIPQHQLIQCQRILESLSKACSRADSMAVDLVKKSSREIFSTVCHRNNTMNQLIRLSRRTFIDILSKWTIATRQGMSERNMEEFMSKFEKESIHMLSEISSWYSLQEIQIKLLTLLSELPGVQLVHTLEQLFIEIESGDTFAIVLHLPTTLPKVLDSFVETFSQSRNHLFNLTECKTETSSPKLESVLVDHRLFFVAGKEFSDWITCHNKDNVSVRYYIFYDQESNEAGSPLIRFYDLRDSTEILYCNYTIPTSPEEVIIEDNYRGVVTLSWQNAKRDDLIYYLLQYRRSNTSGAYWESLKCSANTITIGHLQSDESYVFRVANVTIGGKSPFSPVSDEVVIDSVCPVPSDMKCSCVTDTSVKIHWNHLDVVDEETDQTSERYESCEDHESDESYSRSSFNKDEKIKSKETATFENFSFVIDCWLDDNEESMFIQRSTTEKSITLEPLSPNTVYCVQVRAVCSGTHGSSFSSQACPIFKIKTLEEAERTALIVRRVSQKCSVNDGIDTFKLPMKKQHRGNKTPGIGHYVFGEPSYLALTGKRRQRTILMLGATGSGKSTLINAMINYVLGVEWDDDFRFKMIDEPADKSQAHSQTDLVTTYDLYEMKGSRLGYSLTLVDTPGFGDTRGLVKDKEIMLQIQDYFQCRHGIQQLEAVCFVVQSSLPRLTATQQYIFDSILSIFGQDIQDNIRLMVTFADNAVPPVLEAIKEAGIPSPYDPSTGLPLHHKFNNSIFFTSNKNSRQINEFNRTYFNIAVEGFNGFFDDLSRVETKSLRLTREVLEERKRLEALVEGLQMRTEMKLTRVNELEQIKKILNENQDQIDANKDFEFETLVPKSTNISGTGQFTTNCQNCRMTCHFPCRQASDENKHRCSVMDQNGRCRVCRCSWSNHFNQKYRYEMVKRKIRRSSDAIRSRYQGAVKEALTNQELLRKIEKKISKHEEQLMELMQATYPCIRRLNEIALRPHPFSTPDYIDLMIAAEKQEHRQGYEQRIATLNKLRKMAEITCKLIRNESKTAESGCRREKRKPPGTPAMNCNLT